MSMKITFINPNSSDEVDKYLPKILAEAVLNKISNELTDASAKYNEVDVKHSA
jgi:hypothetical protein